MPLFKDLIVGLHKGTKSASAIYNLRNKLDYKR